MNRRSCTAWAAVLILVTALVLLHRFLSDRTATARVDLATVTARHAAAAAALQKVRAAAVTDAPGAANGVHDQPAPPPAEAEELNHTAAARRLLLSSWFDRVYQPFLRDALLSPAQADAFRQAVIAHWLRWSEAADVFREQGLAPNDPVVQQMGKTEWAQFAQETESALGLPAVEKLREFSRHAPAKPVADTVAALVFDTNEPLRPSQAAAITEVLANNSARFRKGGTASLDDVEFTAVQSQLKDVLSPAQLSALELALTARQSGAKINALLAAARNQSAGPGARLSSPNP